MDEESVEDVVHCHIYEYGNERRLIIGSLDSLTADKFRKSNPKRLGSIEYTRSHSTVYYTEDVLVLLQKNDVNISTVHASHLSPALMRLLMNAVMESNVETIDEIDIFSFNVADAIWVVERYAELVSNAATSPRVKPVFYARGGRLTLNSILAFREARKEMKRVFRSYCVLCVSTDHFDAICEAFDEQERRQLEGFKTAMVGLLVRCEPTTDVKQAAEEVNIDVDRYPPVLMQ
nr:hypothetical protein TetV2_00608 [Oceanusvirus sp.]